MNTNEQDSEIQKYHKWNEHECDSKHIIKMRNEQSRWRMHTEI